MRFYVETYGCAANQGNSEAFSAALIEMGHLPSSLEEANLVIVNTCVVTDRTERNMKKRLSQLQGERLVIAGCLPSAMPEAVRDISCREVMGVLGRSAGMKMGEAFRPEETRPHRIHPAQNLCAVVNISEGAGGGAATA